MQTARNGDTVRVHYRGSLEDGSLFDSSDGDDPIEFTIGESQVISGFEKAIIGMSVGQKKTERIPAENAYGDHIPDLVFHVERSSLQPGAEVEVGDVVRVALPDGKKAPMRVASADVNSVTLDANHPLAGKMLVFDLELVSIG